MSSDALALLAFGLQQVAPETGEAVVLETRGDGATERTRLGAP